MSAGPAEHAIEIDRYGGPQELVWRAVRRPPPAADEVRIEAGELQGRALLVP